jgi:hypothetical protein
MQPPLSLPLCVLPYELLNAGTSPHEGCYTLSGPGYGVT